MFMKLVRLNKIILKIKFINIYCEVAFNNLLNITFTHDLGVDILFSAF